MLPIQFSDTPATRQGLLQFRAQLIAHGFAADGPLAALVQADGTLLLNRWLAPGLGDGSGLELSIRLFAIGEEVDRARFEQAFAPTAVAALRACNLVAIGETRVCANVRLTLWHGLPMFGDRDDNFGNPDWVIPPDDSSSCVADFLADELQSSGRQRVLDVGTGSGCLALLAARHGHEALGIDLTERAVSMARLNNALNDLPASFATCGTDVYAALSAASYDIITFNFPGLYDAGPPSIACSVGDSDEIVAGIFRPLARHLSRDGRAMFRLDVRNQPDDCFEQQLRALGCADDLHICWLTDGEHFECLPGLETGVALVRRRRATDDAFFHRIPAWPGQRWRHVDQYVRTRGLIDAGRFDEAVPQLFDYVTVYRALVMGADGLEDSLALVASVEDTSWMDELTPPVFDVLKRCNGKRTVGELVRAMPGEDVRTIVAELARQGVLWLRGRNL